MENRSNVKVKQKKNENAIDNKFKSMIFHLLFIKDAFLSCAKSELYIHAIIKFLWLHHRNMKNIRRDGGPKV
jgi:hypothetical protein